MFFYIRDLFFYNKMQKQQGGFKIQAYCMIEFYLFKMYIIILRYPAKLTHIIYGI